MLKKNKSSSRIKNPIRIIFKSVLTILAFSTSASAFEKADLVKLMSSNQCPDCDLSMADLRNKDLKGANLANADLFGADLSYADLSGANLSGAILIGANLKKTNLENVKFEAADLREVDLSSSKIKGTNLDKVIFCRTKTPWTEGVIDRDCKPGFFDKLFSNQYESKKLGQGFYIGGISINQRHGAGVYTVPDRYRYVGEWKYGNKHGQGSLNYSNGDYFVGEFKDDNKWRGKEKLTTSDGRAYKGELQGGKWHGKGRYSWPNGDKYIGEWRDGKRHGEGVATFSSGYRYVGKWTNDEQSGHFRVTYPGGDKYEGNLRNGYKHGQGTLTYSDGNKYIGLWKSDVRHGEGTYTWQNGREYVGEWKDNVRHGYGNMTIPGAGKYNGWWKDDKIHGKGKATFSDGSIKDGQWKLGKYVGEWKIKKARDDGGNRNESGSEPEQDYEVELTGVRVSQSNPDHSRVIFNLSGEVEHSLFTLSNPYRVIIDLKNVRKSAALVSEENETLLLRNIRSAVRNNDDLRIVLDLKGKVRPRSFVLQPDKEFGHRLVVDMHATNLSSTPIKASQQERQKKKKTFVIAIDAGHGGKDPGAVGHNGTLEKDITLALAKKMKSIINRTPGYKAILTRETDKYVVLRHRVATARKHQADLFVSLHADAFKSPKVSGASVYVLSLNGASSEAARLIAQKENSSDLIGGVSLDDKDNLIASVLLDLSQTATIQDSLELGSDVLKHLGKVGKLNKSAVQRAGFAVLKAPDMPSILIQTAFISNPREERRLKSPKYQHKIANAIFAGVKFHLDNRIQ
jgi:N-acetylmuramoyl-L-alanine amidase